MYRRVWSTVYITSVSTIFQLYLGIVVTVCIYFVVHFIATAFQF